MSSKGIVYVATGADYLAEASLSAQSVKSCMPEIHTTVFTDELESAAGGFDDVRDFPDCQHAFSDKFWPLQSTPYERTLYLDADTFIAQPCAELFGLLDRFDLALAHDTTRGRLGSKAVPSAFVEFNGGVILFRRTEAVMQTLQHWEELHTRQVSQDPTFLSDQESLREAIYLSDLAIYVLPPEYNCMVWYPGSTAAAATVKIVHGRSGLLPETAELLNRSTAARVFIPNEDFSEQSQILFPKGTQG